MGDQSPAESTISSVDHNADSMLDLMSNLANPPTAPTRVPRNPMDTPLSSNEAVDPAWMPLVETALFAVQEQSNRRLADEFAGSMHGMSQALTKEMQQISVSLKNSTTQTANLFLNISEEAEKSHRMLQQLAASQSQLQEAMAQFISQSASQNASMQTKLESVAELVKRHADSPRLLTRVPASVERAAGVEELIVTRKLPAKLLDRPARMLNEEELTLVTIPEQFGLRRWQSAQPTFDREPMLKFQDLHEYRLPPSANISIFLRGEGPAAHPVRVNAKLYSSTIATLNPLGFWLQPIEDRDWFDKIQDEMNEEHDRSVISLSNNAKLDELTAALKAEPGRALSLVKGTPTTAFIEASSAPLEFTKDLYPSIPMVVDQFIRQCAIAQAWNEHLEGCTCVDEAAKDDSWLNNIEVYHLRNVERLLAQPRFTAWRDASGIDPSPEHRTIRRIISNPSKYSQVLADHKGPCDRCGANGTRNLGIRKGTIVAVMMDSEDDLAHVRTGHFCRACTYSPNSTLDEDGACVVRVANSYEFASIPDKVFTVYPMQEDLPFFVYVPIEAVGRVHIWFGLQLRQQAYAAPTHLRHVGKVVGGKQYNVPRAPSTDVGKDVVDKIPDEYKSTKSDTSESDEARSEKGESSRMPRVSSKDWNMLLKSINERVKTEESKGQVVLLTNDKRNPKAFEYLTHAYTLLESIWDRDVFLQKLSDEPNYLDEFGGQPRLHVEFGQAITKGGLRNEFQQMKVKKAQETIPTMDQLKSYLATHSVTREMATKYLEGIVDQREKDEYQALDKLFTTYTSIIPTVQRVYPELLEEAVYTQFIDAMDKDRVKFIYHRLMPGARRWVDNRMRIDPNIKSDINKVTLEWLQQECTEHANSVAERNRQTSSIRLRDSGRIHSGRREGATVSFSHTTHPEAEREGANGSPQPESELAQVVFALSRLEDALEDSSQASNENIGSHLADVASCATLAQKHVRQQQFAKRAYEQGASSRDTPAAVQQRNKMLNAINPSTQKTLRVLSSNVKCWNPDCGGNHKVTDCPKLQGQPDKVKAILDQHRRPVHDTKRAMLANGTLQTTTETSASDDRFYESDAQSENDFTEDEAETDNEGCSDDE